MMIIATFAAMLIGKYEESIAVIILYSIGEYLQNRAVINSKNEISALMNIKVEYANVLVDGKIVVKDPMQIKVGDTVVIKNGERIPVDGIVTLEFDEFEHQRIDRRNKTQECRHSRRSAKRKHQCRRRHPDSSQKRIPRLDACQNHRAD
ncbi:MAG: hypothetical protein MZU97_17535 [Bacillus subtilis]|nr:hypothetical protein [Bacillus subtilis]